MPSRRGRTCRRESSITGAVATGGRYPQANACALPLNVRALCELALGVLIYARFGRCAGMCSKAFIHEGKHWTVHKTSEGVSESEDVKRVVGI